MDLDHDVLVSSTLLRRCAGTTFKEWSFSLELKPVETRRQEDGGGDRARRVGDTSSV